MASEAHLKIGEKCEAIITGVKDYGLFVRIGNNKGLVHKQKFLIDKYRQSDYSLGMTILVQILEVKADGKLVLAPTIKRKHLS
ncbi:MAG: S1 RNA-binding domain-containing protein [Zoogloea sp.]|nr:S1 RNA-binding domain-containing protein [Zoogloea sp.]